MIAKLGSERTAYDQIEGILGKPYSVSARLKGKGQGSGLFLLEQLSDDNDYGFELPRPGARCNFEVYPKGILLRINYKLQLYGIPLVSDEVSEVVLKKGREAKRGFRLFGRSFRLTSREPLRLEIQAADARLIFSAHGASYTSSLKYWEKSGLNLLVC